MTSEELIALHQSLRTSSVNEEHITARRTFLATSGEFDIHRFLEAGMGYKTNVFKSGKVTEGANQENPELTLSCTSLPFREGEVLIKIDRQWYPQEQIEEWIPNPKSPDELYSLLSKHAKAFPTFLRAQDCATYEFKYVESSKTSENDK